MSTRPVTMTGLTDGMRVWHTGRDDSGQIRIRDGAAWFRAYEDRTDPDAWLEVSPEGPIFPADLEIIGEVTS